MAIPITADIQLYYLSEHAVTVQFGNVISEDNLIKVQQFNKLLHAHPFKGLITTVPAFTTLSVFYDPMILSTDDSISGDYCFDKVSSYLTKLMSQKHHEQNIEATLVEIPVCYGKTYGPDIRDVAAMHHLTPDKVADLHQSAIYYVGMTGFLPGFAYMLGLNDKIATPRKSSPRKIVPAGSIGIAGSQTGIYSLASPGGWQIIGQTPLTLFDVNHDPTTLLKAGDQISFRSITAEEFEDVAHSQYADKHY